MQFKVHELKKKLDNKINYYLLYGPNIVLIEETIDKIFKPVFPKNIINYDEAELLSNIGAFKEMIYNKSFFSDEKFIIINRASNKILNIIEELVESEITDIKIVIKAGLLEKKSKLRNYFEKNKSTIISAFYEDSYQSLLLMLKNVLREKKIDHLGVDASENVVNESKLKGINAICGFFNKKLLDPLFFF